MSKQGLFTWNYWTMKRCSCCAMWVLLVEPEMGVHNLSSIFLEAKQDLTYYFASFCDTPFTTTGNILYHLKPPESPLFCLCTGEMNHSDSSDAPSTILLFLMAFSLHTCQQVPMLELGLQVQSSLTQIGIAAGGRQQRHVSHFPLIEMREIAPHHS